MKLGLLFAPSLLLLACAGQQPPAASPAAASGDTTATSATVEMPTTAPASQAPAAAPTLTLDGKSAELAYGGATYALSEAYVQAQGKSWELHLEQPMSVGYNQIWLMPRDVKKGQPAKVEGTGMSAVFVQLAKGKDNVSNVSSSCSASGTVTFDELPQAGKTAKGSVDVTITCSGVSSLTAPLVIKGSFADLPVKK